MVTNTNDSGEGSLRQAILDANAHPGLDTIAFHIGKGGVQSIQPTSSLPDITVPVIIDGTTQPGFAGRPVIELNGSKAGVGVNGLTIRAGNSTVRGMVINGFRWRFESGGIGIVLLQNGRNLIAGNFLGTDITGTHSMPNESAGIALFGSNYNLIGGTIAENRNLISGNLAGQTGAGIDMEPGTTGNIVQGNYIGTDVTGKQPLPNVGGIGVLAGFNTTIGGTAPGAGNLISGNRGPGVSIGGTNNLIQGNFFGTDASGTQALGNETGIAVSGDNNLIGGTFPEARNLISGNGIADNRGYGIALGGGPDNKIEGNYIGTDVTGTKPIPNHIGIGLGGSGNSIGGLEPGSGNLVSGNSDQGIYLISQIGSTEGNVIQGNYIGTDYAGTVALGNGDGVEFRLDASRLSNNTIGGTTPAARNLISGNRNRGIYLYDLGGGMDSNLVQGNFIGTDISGTDPLGNQVGIYGSSEGSNNVIGGTIPEARNLISGNQTGIQIVFSIVGAGFRVQGNFIGTDVSGTGALGNGIGVKLGEGAWNNLIGGTEAGAGNVISGNTTGVEIEGVGNPAAQDRVEGNFIGTDVTGTGPLGNEGNGVRIGTRTQDNTIGGTEPGAGNIIAFNGNDGVLVDTGQRNGIQQNAIYSSGNLGIELINDGNHNQEFPVLTSAIAEGGFTTIAGTLTSASNTVFRLEFFLNNQCSPSGFGEGKEFFATTTVRTGDNGIAEFSLKIPHDTTLGQFITGTATDSANNTSQFGPCQEVHSPGGSPSRGGIIRFPQTPICESSFPPSQVPILSLPEKQDNLVQLDHLFTCPVFSGKEDRSYNLPHYHQTIEDTSFLDFLTFDAIYS